MASFSKSCWRLQNCILVWKMRLGHVNGSMEWTVHPLQAAGDILRGKLREGLNLWCPAETVWYGSTKRLYLRNFQILFSTKKFTLLRNSQGLPLLAIVYEKKKKKWVQELLILINPFVLPFSTLWKYQKTVTVSWSFQRVEKGWIENKLVKIVH